MGREDRARGPALRVREPGGDHGRVERWRLAQSLHRTIAARPDLIDARGGLSAAEQRLLEEFPPVPYP